ncbi:MAG: hypothetical protein AAGI03_03110 [Pseudomonadota bacterium]
MRDHYEPPSGRSPDDDDLFRWPKGPKRPYPDVLVPGLSIASSGLLALALPDLIGVDGPADWLKCGILAVTAGGVAYGTNRLALDYGTKQAAVGTPGAAVLSVGSMLLIGTAFFTATYSGLVLDRTEQRQLERYSEAQGTHVTNALRSLASGPELSGALGAIVTDMEANALCEATTACVTGGLATEGPTSRFFTTEAGRAQAVLDQVEATENQRAAGEVALSALQEDLSNIATSGDLSASERRAALQGASAGIDRQLASMESASANTIVQGYALELAETSRRAPHPKAGRIFAGYATSLQAAAAEPVSADATVARPAFPEPAGVTDTLREIGAFLPIALLIGALELIFPLALWIYTTLALRTQIVQRETPPDPPHTAPMPPRKPAQKRSRTTSKKESHDA